MARLVILGDFCPHGSHGRTFTEEALDSRPAGLLHILRSADAILLNLEAPITRHQRPAAKVGPALRMDPGVEQALARIGNCCLSLANNHMMDYGKPGLADTLAHLDEAGLPHTGAGFTRSEAGQPLVLDLPGVRVGVLATSANEFGMANEKSPGVNGLQLLALHDSIRSLRDSCDTVIVLVHGGVEGFPYPSPEGRDLGVLLGRFGANLVAFQHSHVIGTLHESSDCLIVHGLGNFYFPSKRTTRSPWHVGMALDLDLEAGRRPSPSLHFFEQCLVDSGLRRLAGDEAEAERTGLRRRSLEAEDPLVLQQLWDDFCWRRGRHMHRRIYAPGKLSGRLARVVGLERWWPGAAGRLLLENLFRCEEHRETMTTYFQQLNEDLKGNRPS
jgi:hypothetical protein